MRRLWLYITVPVAVVVIVILGALYWLLGTAPGARFALTKGAMVAGLKVSIAKVQGRLWDHVVLSGLRAEKGKEVAVVNLLDFSWSPQSLFHGQLLVRRLALTGVRVQDDTPPSGKAPDLTWPRLTGFLTSLRVKVLLLQLDALTYRRFDEQPVVVKDLFSSLIIDNGLLSLPRLAIQAPEGRASGSLTIGLIHPSLKIDLAARTAQPLQGMEDFYLTGDLAPARAPEQMSGPLTLTGRHRGKERLKVAGTVGMTANGFTLRQVTLDRSGRRGSVTADGTLTLTAGDPLFSLWLKARELDLAEAVKRPTRLSGSLNITGSVADYRGRFSLANRGPGWESASLASDFRGGKGGVTLSRIDGKLLDGTLRGDLVIAWEKLLRVSGTLSGRGINPGRLMAGWPGAVNLDLAGNLELPAGGKPAGSVKGKLLESRLRGQTLHGDVAADFAGEWLRVDRLLLSGNGFDLRGAGVLDHRLELSARVSDLSRILPGASGELSASGWVRRRDGTWSGSASGEGAGVAVSGVKAAAVQLEASLGEGRDYPLSLTASLRGVAAGNFQVDSVELGMQGTAASHRLEAQVVSPRAEAKVELSGGYRNGTWNGLLTTFSGRDAVGPWALAAPSRLSVSRSAFSASPLVIDGLPGERVEVAGTMNRGTRSSTLAGSWTGLNLSRADSWLKGEKVTGTTTGRLDLTLFPGGAVVVALDAEASGTFEGERERVSLQRGTVMLRGDRHGMEAKADLQLAGGSGDAHLTFTSTAPATLRLPREGDLSLQLANFDLALFAPAAPAGSTVEGRVGGLLRGKLLSSSRLELRGNLSVAGGKVRYREKDQDVEGVLDTAEVEFNWWGSTAGKQWEKGILEVSARLSGSATVAAKEQRVVLSRFSLRLDGNRQGTRASLDASLQSGGSVRALLSSPAPIGLGLPATGDLSVEWGGINPALLKPMLPAGLDLEGNFAGQGSGRLLPGQRVEFAGEAVFSQGKANWQSQGGELEANVRTATLTFAWRGDALSADLNLALADYGQASGNLVLPIPARLPVAPDPGGPVRGRFAGRVQEHGLLTSFLPGLVQESHGQLDLDLQVGGIWSDPRLDGTLQLTGAGAYLPRAGITLSNVQLAARLQGDQIVVDTLRADSGAGSLQGKLQARLSGWRIAGYSGTLTGDRFRTVFLPELQMVTSPRLAFQGGADKVVVRGTVLVPEMLVAGPPVRSAAEQSPDVVLEGAPPKVAKPGFPLVLDGAIHVALGDKVQVKASGIDARLGGEMDLVLAGLDHITSSGEIKVVKGSYRAYGMDLDIVRGRIYYNNDPVTQPTLDILALRTVGDVKAGVTVGGYLRSPVIKLYSEPSMADVDILAYMLFGHPLSAGTGTEQAGTLAMAASSLFSTGQSESLQEQIKDRLGLSILGMETITPSTAGRMGYREVPITSPTGVPSKAAATQSLLTVGKYVTPRLYVSYGRSLVTGGSLFQLRYDLFRHIQVETQSGSESGADIYYKLEFD
ncbi:translocation/assembly module TamB domain-containing protein [Geomonas sp. Red32]|uniref:translocation/assembly module TamB domain-containing protein n=1 Tax=Geomonas sp. Red32 TaxID=2912856 RepID=UPI00202CE252|nr:translocation/assembly module TamB domain-containing protein [Geomonas sp. Red32]MCM0081954.1 translocation/assembly module TamB domain-containing protein [Geomonas sp. Red32]